MAQKPKLLTFVSFNSLIMEYKSTKCKYQTPKLDVMLNHFYQAHIFMRGTWWRSWLRHCAASWKVAGLIPDGVVGFLHSHNPSGHTMALGLTQPRTEMRTRNMRFVQKVSSLTTVHEVDKAYGVLTLIVFNIVPFRSYTLRPTFLPLLETFCELLFRDV